VNAGVRYQFSRNFEGDFSIQHQFFKTRRKTRQDNWVLSVNPNFYYRLNPRHRVGMGVSYYHQDFKASDFTVGSQTNTVNAYAQWEWQIDSTMGLSLRVGPAYIESEQDNPPQRGVLPIPYQEISDYPGGRAVQIQVFSQCPDVSTTIPASTAGPYIPATGCPPSASTVNPSIIAEADFPSQYAAITNQTPIGLTTTGNVGTKDDSLDVFVNVQLIKNWSPQLSSQVAYQRTQGTASGLGGAVIRDTVTGSVNWSFRDRWKLSTSAAWTNRESVGDVNEFFLLAEENLTLGLPNIASYTGTQLVATSGNQRVETALWSVSTRLSHRLYRKTHVFAQGTYTDQTSKGGTLGAGSDFDDWLAIVGVRHEFEPIGLW
jgi:long-subunit fatty acid transport protein